MGHSARRAYARQTHTTPALLFSLRRQQQHTLVYPLVRLCMWPWAWLTVSQTIDSSSPGLHFPPSYHFLLAWIIWCCNWRSISSAQSARLFREACRHSLLGPRTGWVLFMRWCSVGLWVEVHTQVKKKTHTVDQCLLCFYCDLLCILDIHFYQYVCYLETLLMQYSKLSCTQTRSDTSGRVVRAHHRKVGWGLLCCWWGFGCDVEMIRPYLWRDSVTVASDLLKFAQHVGLMRRT